MPFFFRLEKRIRLAGSHQANMGRIEVYFAGRLGAIYPWFRTSSMRKNALVVMCRQLGYAGDSLSGEDMFCSEAVLPWFTNLRCNGSEISLNQCGLDFYPHTSVACMNIICTNQKAGSGKYNSSKLWQSIRNRTRDNIRSLMLSLPRPQVN